MDTSKSVAFLGNAALIVSFVSAALLTTSTSASPVVAGFDFFRSNDALGQSLGASVDLSAFNMGIVPLQGVPLPPLPFPFGPLDGLGIDTIVERKQGINPFGPPGGSGIIDIELVALHLTSIDPVDLTPLGGPFTGLFGDLHTIINKDGLIPGLPQPDPLPPSLGKMEIRHELGPLPADDIGGTFDSIFGEPGDLNVPLDLQGLLTPGSGVTADAIFTIPGGDPANPLDVLFSAVAPRLTIWSEDSTWAHTPFTDFQVTGIDHNCSFSACHPVEPVDNIPEPMSLVLLVFGGQMLACRRRKRC